MVKRIRKRVKRRVSHPRSLTAVQVIARSVTTTNAYTRAVAECSKVFEQAVSATIDQYLKNAVTQTPASPEENQAPGPSHASAKPIDEECPVDADAPQHSPPAADQVDLRFWEIWLEHESYLRRYAKRLLPGAVDDVEDILSQTMLKASSKFDYAEIDNHRAWLRKNVYNACMDFYRGSSIKDRCQQDITASMYFHEATTPLKTIESIEHVQQLEKELSELPESLRLPLLMRFMDLPYEQIAELLDLTKATARKRIQLARDRLRPLH